MEVLGFDGWYLYKGKKVPVYKVYSNVLKQQIFILNKNKLGKLIQHSPLEGDETEQITIFYLKVSQFAEEEALMEKFIEKPPAWLKQLGDESTQREYLQKRVLLQILERFEFRKHEEFEGYLLELEEEKE